MTSAVFTPRFAEIEKRNRDNLKALKHPVLSAEYIFAMYGDKPLLLIGPGHDKETARRVMGQVKQRKGASGVIAVTKGELFEGPGELRVYGNSALQSGMTQALKAFSKKKVIYEVGQGRNERAQRISWGV